MKTAFFTEGIINQKIPRDYPNMRTDLAWRNALNADHHSFSIIPWPEDTEYDLGIVIIPKQLTFVDNLIPLVRKICKKVAIMQEGPSWLWQDHSMELQIWYYNTLQEADFLLCHNKSDQRYYAGLTGKDTYVMPSLMIEDSIKDITTGRYKNMNEVMIGGNMTSWYGGFDSMIVAQEFGCEIKAPSMGRKIEREDELDINHLPYMNWVQWIDELSMVKYGVHMMRTHAAGTFALNCAYLGIPCIGYKGLDTQEMCHPDCTVELGDLESAKKIARKLRNDNDFYLYCSNIAKLMYAEHYAESKYIEQFNKIMEKV
tara:strand:- start:209 stop:1150 length:942 start_codon:yes stop_codon:yes gene_type:complete